MSVSPNVAGSPSTPATAETLKAAETTATFIDSVGVNMHSGVAAQDIPYNYRDPALVEHSLQYLNVTHIRDALGAGFSKTGYDYTTTSEKYLAAKGYKYDFSINNLAPYEINALHNFVSSYPGALDSIEGINEANSLTVDQAVSFQKSLFDFVHNDPLLKDTPVMNFTLTYGQPHYFEKYGNLAPITDEGNVHIYGTYGRSPSASSFAAWLSVAQAATPGRRMDITETGYATLPSDTYAGVDETTQAKYILNTLMDAAENNVNRTYIYELFDKNSSNGASPIQGHFGLFAADGTPKPSAVAIHNLMAIFSTDADKSAEPGSLDVVFNKPLDKNIQKLVIQKNYNTFDLVLWAEPTIWDSKTHAPIQAPTLTVDLSLPNAKTSVLFDPLVGTAPVRVFDDPGASSTINVTDHPVIIEVTLADPQGARVTSVANLAALEQNARVTTIAVSDVAANLRSVLAALGADTRIQSITVSDGNPLALTYADYASDAAGLGKIASYGLALSGVSVANLAVEKDAHVTTVGVSDTAAKLTGTVLGALGADAKVPSIAAIDGKPIVLTYAQYTADGAAIGKLASGTKITVTGASLSGSSAIEGDKNVTSITIRDRAVTIDYRVMVASDGSKFTDQYDASGALTSRSVVAINGYSDIRTFTNGVLAKEVTTYAPGGMETSDTRLYATVGGTPVLTSERQLHANKSQDLFLSAITGKSYVAEHDIYNAAGTLAETIRTHADGTFDYHNVLSADGTKTTDIYDASGVLNSHAVIGPSAASDMFVYSNVDGHAVLASETHKYAPGGPETSDTKLYATVGGTPVLTSERQLHANKSQDVFLSAITGKSYVAEHDIYNAAGTLAETIRTHADGTFDYHHVLSADGTKTTDIYDASGVLNSHAVLSPNGASDMFVYSNVNGHAVLASETHKYAAGGPETSDTKLYATVGGTSVLTSEKQLHANKSQDVFLSAITGKSYVAEHDIYTAAGALASADRLNTDGSHTQTAYQPGATLVSTAGAADQFQSFGSDTFVFAAGSGRDTVTGFHPGSGAGHDVLVLDQSQVSSFADLRSSHMSTSGNDTLITLSSTDTIVLKNVNPATLTAADFHFQAHS